VLVRVTRLSRTGRSAIALLPAKLILLCIAVFCALAFFAGAFLRNLQLPAIAPAQDAAPLPGISSGSIHLARATRATPGRH
jgi:hypothetical protein